MSLTGKTKASSYKDILQMNNSNSGVDATTRNVVDGEGTASALSISSDRILIKPDSADSTSTFNIADKDANNLLAVDSTNDLVKAGIGQHIVNTNIKEFGLDFTSASPDTADTWHALTSSSNHTDNNELEMGTGSTPATTLTIVNTAYIVVKHYWYVPSNITIDSCNVWFGADAASGDVVKFSVMSYTVDSANGSTGGDLSSKGTTSASLSSNYEEVFSLSQVLDNDNGLHTILTNSGSVGSLSLSDCKTLMIKNSGASGAEISIALNEWTAGTPDADVGAISYATMLLASGEFIMLPTVRMLQYNSSNSAANSYQLNNQVPDANMYVAVDNPAAGDAQLIVKQI